MRRLLFLLIIPIQTVFGQPIVQLDSCYSWARTNYPNLKQANIWHEIISLRKENIQTSYLPRVTLNAQATYQSDVPGIDIPLPNISIPTVSKDQFKAYAEFKQIIWDGGIYEMNSKLEDAILKSNLSQLEVEFYKLNEQVAQAFFVGLIVDKQILVITSQKETLLEKLKMAESGIKNGVIEKSAALVLKAEILKLEQKEIQLRSGKNAALKTLSILTGKQISNDSQLQPDQNIISPTQELNRPEQVLFSDQTDQLGIQIELLNKTRNPKLFGFGQAGYGKPGLNMLNNEFDTYYLIGLGISWNAFDWKNTFRKKKMLKLNQEIIQTQKKTFAQNIQMLLSQQSEQISKLKLILKNDTKMISLRSEIAKSAASKLENETITTSDYIHEVQAETISKLNYELHKIQLQEVQEKYRLIKGK